MNWTTEIPQKNGWYWTRYIDDHKSITILEYEFTEDRFKVYNDARETEEEVLHSNIPPNYVEWYGPIEPPI